MAPLVYSDTLDDELLVRHVILHKDDLNGGDVVHEHISVVLELEARGFEHQLYTDLDHRSELMVKNGLESSDLGSMSGGTGVQSPQQGGGVQGGKKRRKKILVEPSAVSNGMYKRFIDSVSRGHISSEDFVDPSRRRFPIQVPGDITSAMHAFGLAKPLIPLQQFRRRLMTIARRKGQSFVDELPKSWLDGTDMAKSSLELIDGEIATYSVLTKSDPQRFTLGVMYPANETDSQEEYADENTVEQAAWWFMQKGGQAGYMHIMGAGGKLYGDVVESYVYRNPVPWKVVDVSGNEQMVKKGDWVGGVIWTPTIWQDILAGKLTGYSIHGSKVIEHLSQTA